MKRINSLVLIGLLSFCLMASVGCGRTKTDQLTSPVLSKEMVESEVVYVGNESSEEVLANISATEKATSYFFSAEQKEQMLQEFRRFRESEASRSPAQTLTTITAYTCYYVYSSDKDLYLEYKWLNGYSHAYHFETPNWTMYWLIKACYGGRLTSWSWMEGGYQRVTAIVGWCIYRPLGASFTQSYLWVVSN